MIFADVSVVIPCYRCSDVIERAVTSVWEQTLRPAEVILVDDCSGDGTVDTLYALQKKFPPNWIKVIELEQNSGPGEARNAGWAAASHSYVAFLDADDSWHPQKIEIQYSWMIEHPDVVLTGHECVRHSGNINRAHEITDSEPVRVYPVSKTQLLFRNRFPTCSVMLRRDIPHRFATGKYHSEDYLLWLEIVCAGHRAYKLDKPLAYIYKAEFGEGGLSAQIWSMQKGELDTYRRLRRSKFVSPLVYLLLQLWSWVRFLRRLGFFILLKLRTP